MKSKFISKCLAALTSCLMLTSGLSVLPYTSVSAADNIISNSTFDSGTSGWSTYKESGGACSLGTENGRLALKISSVGTLNYSVQVGYSVVPLYQNGVYRLKYDISSTVNRTVEGMIQQNGGTYQAYTWKSISLTPQMQTVDYTFTMEAETDIMAKLVFNCGNQGESLGEHTIYIDNVSLELLDGGDVSYDDFQAYTPDIFTNQIGYKPDSDKIAVFKDASNGEKFSVINQQTGQTVYEGNLYGGTENSSAGETDYYGDFSQLTQPGTYYIKCGSLDDSYTFKIAEDLYSGLLDDTVRMFYLQRCGTTVNDSTFGHAACHTSTATVYGTNERIDVSGGWHDAGDYGRYIVAAAKAVADLLYAYDTNPEMFTDNVGIPESGNNIPDVLDEVRYELEWMLKMQNSSGGVYHKVTCANFPGYVMPEQETGQLIVTPVSTTATADFCASMAMAYEFYKDVDSAFANKCLAAAEKAWSYLEANPNLIFNNPSDITTGEYGDTTDKDERYWAAAQLYRATKNEAYLNAAMSISVRTGLDWSTVGDYGNIAILTMDNIDKNSNAYTRVLASVKSQADKLATATSNSAYGVAVSKFNWGSNMTVANAGIILGLAYEITQDEKYLDAAQSNLNYLLGRNPNGVCYVTGYGTVSPTQPHHRPSMAKNQAMKGMLVGGVNQNLEDDAAKAYCSSYPTAKRYVDNWESYSTNEITIYWNSPLIYLLSLTEDTQQEDVTYILGDADSNSVVNIFDVVRARRSVLNNTANSLMNILDLNGDNNVNGTDIAMLQEFITGKIKQFAVG